MISGKVIIENPSGIHLRPAGILCEEALRFECNISFRIRNTTANAKSVLSVLGACVKYGDEIELLCEGVEEEKAFATLMALIESGLGDKLENKGID
jgi:phosphocarrier protein HPr